MTTQSNRRAQDWADRVDSSINQVPPFEDSQWRRLGMQSDDAWVAERIAVIRKDHPLVTEGVSARMIALLRKELSAGQMSRAELTATAGALLAAMEAVPPRVDPEQ